MVMASAYQDHHGMTINMRLFCEHYLSNNRNGVQAVRSAYGGNKSDNVCHSMASENLRKPAIKKYLEAKVKEAIEKAGVGLEWRLDTLKKITQACMDGSASKDALVAPEAAIKAVSEVNKMDGYIAKFKSEY